MNLFSLVSFSSCAMMKFSIALIISPSVVRRRLMSVMAVNTSPRQGRGTGTTTTAAAATANHHMLIHLQ